MGAVLAPGLAIVWSIIHDHGGFVNVKSGMDGTTFEIFIPSTCDAELCKSPVISVNALRGGGEVVLVVDDEETQRLTTRDLLTSIGYSAVTAASGEDAAAAGRCRLP